MNISSLLRIKRNPKIPDIIPGDTVRVSAKIVEGGKQRIQEFQGVVIKVRHGNASASFTVRHVAYGIGVERTFLLYSPLVEKVEIVRHGRVRRSKLYYLRGLSGKEARRKIKRVERKAKEIGEEILTTEPEVILESEEVEAVTEDEANIVELPKDEEANEPELVAEEEVKAEKSMEDSEAMVDLQMNQEDENDNEPFQEPEAIHKEPTSETEVESIVEKNKLTTFVDSKKQEPIADMKEETEITVELAESEELNK